MNEDLGFYSTGSMALVWASFVLTITLILRYFRSTEADVNMLVVDTNTSWATVDKRFLSVTIDTSILSDGAKIWKKFDTCSPVLQNLAKALSPAYLRFGGTTGDYLKFVSEKTTHTVKMESLPAVENVTMTGADWKKLVYFTAAVGWRLVFGLNALMRKQDVWDSRNAQELLEYNSKLGVMVDWELGNELNAHHQLTGVQLGNDFVTLKWLLKQYATTQNSLLVGPDMTFTEKHDDILFLQDFLHQAVRVINFATFHQYYLNGKTAQLVDFLNITVMNSLQPKIEKFQSTVSAIARNLSVWLGETSSAYGGGAPGLSDTFAAGFLWLDKLGMAAKMGVQVVMRQTFYKGSYSLINETFSPLPDYWLSLLHKWLVGTKVLKATISPINKNLRIYAHCTARDRINGPPGAVTVFGTNLSNTSLIVGLDKKFGRSTVNQYILSPCKPFDLKSRCVKLNQKELKMVNGTLPTISPIKMPPENYLVFPPLNFAFYVFPQLNASTCMK